MTTLCFIAILVFAFAFSVVAQNSCPNVSVTGPSGITRPGENMIFTAKVEGYDLDKIRYEWTVENGVVGSGQGTSIVSIPFTKEMVGETITASIRIIGLPENCPNTASSSGACEDCGYIRQPIIILIDEFSSIPPRIHKERLETIKTELSDNPTAAIYIVENIEQGVSRSAVKQKVKNTFDYLIKILKTDKERVFLQIVYGNTNLTQFWYVLPDVSPPNENTEKIELNGENYQQKLNDIFPTSKKKSQQKVTKKL